MTGRAAIRNGMHAANFSVRAGIYFVLAGRPRSAGVPFTEDDCLNDVGYLADEAWDQTEFQATGEPDDAWRWCFGFMSGASIVVAAKSAMLRLGPPTG